MFFLLGVIIEFVPCRIRRVHLNFRLTSVHLTTLCECFLLFAHGTLRIILPALPCPKYINTSKKSSPALLCQKAVTVYLKPAWHTHTYNADDIKHAVSRPNL